MMPGIWSVTVSDQIGCSVTVGIDITTPPDLTILTSNQKDPTCYNGIDGDIEVLANGGVPFSSSPQYLLTWDSNNPQTPIGPSHVANAPAGDYWVYVEDAAGCIDSLLITLNNPPEIEAFFTIKPIICHGESSGSIIIDSVHYAATNYVFNWNIDFDNNNIPDIPNTSNIANNLPTGSYEVTIVDANNCAKPFTNIIVPEADSLYVSNLSVFQDAICVNPPVSTDGYGQISFDPQGGLLAGATNNEGTDYYYQQNTTYLIYESTGDTTYLSNGTKGHLNGGDYTVHLVNEFGCQATPATITLPTLSPIAAFTATSDEFTSNYVGTAPVEVTFTNVSSNYDFANNTSYNTTGPYDVDTLFTWFFVDLNGDTSVYNTESLAQIVKNYTEEGLYYVCLEVEENLNHCIDSTCIEIQIFDAPQLVAPNVFTPEGDGVNDYFFFPNSAIVEFKAVVLDRWGKKVFEFNDIDTKWDGTNITNGKPCTDGVYFYTYEGESSNGTKYKGQGNVQLLRKK
jgi:gliding motility-associated-like protein